MSTLGKLLSNPLIAGVLAAHALGETARAYNESQNAPDPNDEKFERQALVSGSPVTEMPRTGLFSHFMGPIKATPDQMNKETLALREQSMNQIGAVQKGAELANKIGSQNYNDLMSSYFGKVPGLQPLQHETPAEIRANKTGQKDTLVEEYPVGKVAGSSGEISESRAAMLARGGPKPGFATKPSAKPPESPEEVGAKAVARTLAVSNAIDSKMSLDERNAIKKSGFYDPDTGEKVSGKGWTAAKARDKGYVDISDKDAPQFREFHAALKSVDELDGILPSLFVDTSKMSPDAARKAVARNAQDKLGYQIAIPFSGGRKIQLWGKQGIDPNVAKLQQQAFTVAIPAIYATQHRYAPTTEIKMAQDFTLPDLSKDDLKTARAKLMAFKKFMSDSTIKGMSSNRSADEATDVMGAVDKFLEKSDSSSSESSTEGLVAEPPAESIETHPPEDE